MQIKQASLTLPAVNDLLPSAVRVAAYYGFVPFELAGGRFRSDGRDSEELRDMFGSALANFLSAHVGKPEREPLMLYHLSAGPNTSFGLDIVGVNQSMAETLILKTALSIFEEAGIDDICVHINSMGDRDSALRFTRELQNFLRKHIEDLPPKARELMKKDIFAAFLFVSTKCRELFAEAPRPMEYLSEASRRHLREVLEYMERVGIAYEVDEDLVAASSGYLPTIF